MRIFSILRRMFLDGKQFFDTRHTTSAGRLTISLAIKVL